MSPLATLCRHAVPVPPGGRCDRCVSEDRERDRQRGNSTQRGYGTQHRRTRELLLAMLADDTPCGICGKPMNRHDDDLGLDHTTPLAQDPTSKGDRIVHARCNRGRGARVASQTGNATTLPPGFSRSVRDVGVADPPSVA